MKKEVFAKNNIACCREEKNVDMKFMYDIYDRIKAKQFETK